MLIERIAYVYANSPYESCNQIICKKIFTLKEEIALFSLKDFMKEACVSKSTMQRFLALIGLKEFKVLKTTLYTEFLRFKIRINFNKSSKTDEDLQTFLQAIKSAKRILVLGDANIRNIFELYLPYLLIEQYDIYFYQSLFFDPEEFESYALSEQDVIVYGSLTSSLEELREQSSLMAERFWLDYPCAAKKICIGKKALPYQNKSDILLSFADSANIQMNITRLSDVLFTLI